MLVDRENHLTGVAGNEVIRSTVVVLRLITVEGRIMVYVRFPLFDRDATVTWFPDTSISNSNSNKPFYLHHPPRKFSSFNMLWTNVLVILLFLGKIIVADNLGK